MAIPSSACARCSERLFDTVPYCPYCGTAQSPASTVSPLAPKKSPSTAAKSIATAAAAAASSPQPQQNAPPRPAAIPPPLPPVSRDAPLKAPLSEALPPPLPSRAPPAPSAPVPPVPPVPPAVTPVTPPVARSSKTRWLGIGGVTLAALLIVGYQASRPNEKELACEQHLASAAQSQAQGDGTSARSQSALAVLACTGPSQARALALQAAADQALATQASLAAAQATCERGYRRVSSQMGENRLRSARSTLDQLDGTCLESAAGRTERLKLDAAFSLSESTEALVRRKLAEGDLPAARAALDQLAAQNREHPDLNSLRQDIRTAAATQDSAAERAAALSALAIQPAVPNSRPPAAAPTPTPATVAQPQTELARTFLRDAETAMQQLQFDKAKTLVESAERIDPSNVQAAALARRIKERELEYARKEMIIR